jgi:hypothetical protein
VSDAEEVLLLHERRAEDEEDASGDLRWCVRADGAFLHARRDEDLRVARRFDAGQLERLLIALRKADLPGLAGAHGEAPDEGGIVERWSVPGAIVEVFDTDDEPAAITALRVVVDRLVTESPRLPGGAT